MAGKCYRVTEGCDGNNVKSVGNGDPVLKGFLSKDNTTFQSMINVYKGPSGAWGTIAPEKFAFLANIVDMSYNYFSKSTYHKHTITKELIVDVRTSSPGFIAVQMFSEYLITIGKAKGIVEALLIIKDWVNMSKLDEYVGLSYANTSWRQAAMYRDKAASGDFQKSFNTIFFNDSEKTTLEKDKIQLRTCAFLMSTYVLGNEGTYYSNREHYIKQTYKDGTFKDKDGKVQDKYRLVVLGDFDETTKLFIASINNVSGGKQPLKWTLSSRPHLIYKGKKHSVYECLTKKNQNIYAVKLLNDRTRKYDYKTITV